MATIRLTPSTVYNAAGTSYLTVTSAQPVLQLQIHQHLHQTVISTFVDLILMMYLLMLL